MAAKETAKEAEPVKSAEENEAEPVKSAEENEAEKKPAKKGGGKRGK